jgi:hypothetical protein
MFARISALVLVALLGTTTVVGCAAAADDSSSNGGGGGGNTGEGEDNFTSADIGKSEQLLAKAVTLAEKHAAGRACDDDAYLSTIVDTLRQAIAARNTVYFRTKVIAKKEVLAKELAGTLEWQEILGVYNPQKPETLATAFGAGVSLWDVNGGVYGNTQRIELKANGKAIIHTLDTESQDFHWNQKETTWRLEGSKLTLGTGLALSTEWKDGMLSAKKDGGLAFISQKSECEA